MNINANVTNGFTLIELMIVIAIVGILSAIAMPIYIDYTARTQASEGFKVTLGIQSDISTFVADRNYWPKQASLPNVASLSGKYFNENDVSITGGDTAAPATSVSVINVYFRRGANSNQTLKIKPILESNTMQIKGWQCSGINPSSRLPTACL